MILERNLKILHDLKIGYNTVLIKHTYNQIIIFKEVSGLDINRDLGNKDWYDIGKDWKDWYTEDLYTYCEMDTEELRELAQAYYFIIN